MKTHEIVNVSLGSFRSSHDNAAVIFTRETLNAKYHKDSNVSSSDMDFDKVLEIADDILVYVLNTVEKCAVFSVGKCFCRLNFYHGSYSWSVAGDDRSEVEKLDISLKDAIPKMEVEPDDTTVPLSFWTLGPQGVNCRTRRITIPSWSDIRHNYPSEVGDGLNQLMKLQPGHSGQLIMFHGEPGTGKSYAIRALLKQWNNWCSGEYIVDPEKFFGQSAEYMLSVLLGGGNEDEDGDSWSLYIIEDGDEFLTDDAKVRSGQALSRLLNVVDGMIGQGLRIIVLVTTNEPLDHIHPAVIRPGRCLANIEFRKFNTQESTVWLNGSDPKAAPDDSQTLADLYHIRGDIKSLQPDTVKPAMGFVRRV